MSQLNQEFTAGRIQPSQYDVILPPDARAEILKPKRARILVRPPPPSQKPPRAKLARFRVYPVMGWLAVLAAIALMAVMALNWPSPEKRERALQESAQAGRKAEAKAAEAMKALRGSSTASATVQPNPAPTVQPTPTPILEPTPYTSWESYIAAHRVPRAELLKLPAPKAELVLAHGVQSAQAYLFVMPYDGSFTVRGVFKGYLADVAQLPQSGNTIGDTWVIGRTPWVWVTVPGTSAPIWVDP
jgi:hypothetical protein